MKLLKKQGVFNQFYVNKKTVYKALLYLLCISTVIIILYSIKILFLGSIDSLEHYRRVEDRALTVDATVSAYSSYDDDGDSDSGPTYALIFSTSGNQYTVNTNAKKFNEVESGDIFYSVFLPKMKKPVLSYNQKGFFG